MWMNEKKNGWAQGDKGSINGKGFEDMPIANQG